jgi:hypothetical protein
MAEHAFAEPLTPTFDRAAIAAADPEIGRGANWFWWIAALSLVNTVIIHSGGDLNFVIGLGVMVLADAIFKEHLIFAIVFDVIALGTICGLALLSRRGHLWAFILGIIFYTLDATIYLMFQDWMSAAFHGLALFYMIKGAMALRAGLRAAREAPAEEVPTVP